jgi:hypothetical protein
MDFYFNSETEEKKEKKKPKPKMKDIFQLPKDKGMLKVINKKELQLKKKNKAT